MTCPSKSYFSYKPSAVEWLGDVPEHWEVRRLRSVAEMRVSNVDKHTKEDEFPVRLCNYMEVYKNDRIALAMPFMRATASRGEIQRFRLERDDVLITKDSEAWDDIGIPALVTESAADLLAGYHLALLRPFKVTLGAYLARALESRTVAHQFHIAANGVTRFGLTHQAIHSIRLPLPPLPEQAAIVRYLDHVDWCIRPYVRAKRKLIALLEEEKQAVVNQAVTRGLDLNVRLKPSGVEWLSGVPEHWEVRRLKEVATIIAGQSPPSGIVSEYLGDCPFLQGSAEFGRMHPNPRLACNKPPKVARLGDILLSVRAPVGTLNVADREYGIGRGLCAVRARPGLEGLFTYYAIGVANQELIRLSTGSTYDAVTVGIVGGLGLPIPPSFEQAKIVEYLDKAAAYNEAAIVRARGQIELVQEYHIKLIADVVTGKLDVREVAAQLPDESTEQDPIGKYRPLADSVSEVLDEPDEWAEEMAMKSKVVA